MRLETPNFFAGRSNLSPGCGDTTDARDGHGRIPMNNSSFFTADRTTHLKIVVVSLLASIVVLVVGILARPVSSDNIATVYKPQKAIMATTGETKEVR